MRKREQDGRTMRQRWWDEVIRLAPIMSSFSPGEVLATAAENVGMIGIRWKTVDMFLTCRMQHRRNGEIHSVSPGWRTDPSYHWNKRVRRTPRTSAQVRVFEKV